MCPASCPSSACATGCKPWYSPTSAASSSPRWRRFEVVDHAAIFSAMADQPRRSVVERRIVRSGVDDAREGKPLSRRARQTRRTVEAYLAAGVMPRYMERLREIESSIALERRRLDRSWRSLAKACRHDPEQFARRWGARATAWP